MLGTQSRKINNTYAFLTFVPMMRLDMFRAAERNLA